LEKGLEKLLILQTNASKNCQFHKRLQKLPIVQKNAVNGENRLQNSV
jgi:hypothetical protein